MTHHAFFNLHGNQALTERCGKALATLLKDCDVLAPGKCADFIMLDIIKQCGYLEREYGRFYEWKDGFQPPYDKTSFQCRIDIIGNSRNYRCKNVYRGGIGQTQFTYGTEIEDLEISKGIEYIKNYLKNTHIDPKAKPF